MHLNCVLFGLKSSSLNNFYAPIFSGHFSFFVLTLQIKSFIIFTDSDGGVIVNGVFEKKEYKHSRAAYAMQATLEYLITLMVTDAFLAKILIHLGISDSAIGIIATFISLAMVIQLGSLSLSGIKAKTKTVVTVCSTVSQVLFALVYVIPFIPIAATLKKVLAIAFILVAYASMYVVWPIMYRWAYKFVSPDKRASFSATKEMLSLGLGIVFTLVVGWVIDRFEGLGNISGAFVFIAVSMAVISVCNVLCLLSMKSEPDEGERMKKRSFSEIVSNTFGNKSFNSCVFAISLWEFARFFQLGFMGTFKTKDLLISVSAIQVINMVGYGIRLAMSKPVARFSDKYGYGAGFQLGLVIAASAFLVNVFTTKQTWYFVVIYTVLHQLCYVGVNSNSYNILYSYVDNAYISEALAIKNCIAGISGFAAALIAGKLLSFVQQNGNTFFGIRMFGQQLLSAVSFLLAAAALLYVRFVLSKQKNE